MLKWGISQNPLTRYAQGFLEDKDLEIMTAGSRREMLDLERWIVESAIRGLSIGSPGLEPKLAMFPEDDTGQSAKALSIGSVVGGGMPSNQPWREAIKELRRRVKSAASGTQVPLNLNVVFHVPGNLIKPDYIGVRTGSFSEARALLMVQVALPEAIPADPLLYVIHAASDAIDEAGRWAAGRGVVADVQRLKDILGHA